MATKKKPFMTYVFKTKEEFDNMFDKIYKSGYESGFSDGRVNALAYVYEHFGKLEGEFTYDERDNAMYQKRQNEIRAWKHEQKVKAEAESAKFRKMINGLKKEHEEES